ncbi:MAG: CPBP family intramembrane glutamic endopeptidase [Candidatus Omnitrophota bacterium]
MDNNNKHIDSWLFVALLFISTITVGLFFKNGANVPLSVIPIIAGLIAFFLWSLVHKRPIVEMYSKAYPYRKLKLWGGILAVLFFEYTLFCGLNTKQLQLTDQHLYSIIAVFAGAIAFYFAFIRMKVSLRYLFLGVSIPIFAAGCSMGMGRYFGFINFSSPAENVIKTVIINTSYWIVFSILYQLVCEEAAFRGFLMQRLISSKDKRARAVILSSLVFALWHITIGVFKGMNVAQGLVSFAENFVIGCFLALLFLKGKNLLISAISYGIITGLKISMLASGKYLGLSEYFSITTTASELKFILLWLGCLLMGVILVLTIPEKKRPAVVYYRGKLE